MPETMLPLDFNRNNNGLTINPLSLSSTSNGAALALLVASNELRSMIGFTGPLLKPVVKLIFQSPTGPLNVTQVSVPQGAPSKTPVVAAPLESLSSTVATAFEANPAVNNGAAASVAAIRSFRSMMLSQKDQICFRRAASALLTTAI